MTTVKKSKFYKISASIKRKILVAQLTMAFEAGYKACERGENLQMAMEKAKLK